MIPKPDQLGIRSSVFLGEKDASIDIMVHRQKLDGLVERLVCESILAWRFPFADPMQVVIELQHIRGPCRPKTPSHSLMFHRRMLDGCGRVGTWLAVLMAHVERENRVRNEDLSVLGFLP